LPSLAGLPWQRCFDRATGSGATLTAAECPAARLDGTPAHRCVSATNVTDGTERGTFDPASATPRSPRLVVEVITNDDRTHT
jgi:hypothetical protein